MTKLLWIIIVIISGMLIPVQAGLNAMVKQISNGLIAGGWNTMLATIVFIGALLVIRLPYPTIAALTTLPWWAYLGGLCSAFYVFTSLSSAHILGAVLLIVCLTAGQMIGSVILDHFGWLGYSVKPLTLARLFGIFCVITGIYFIQR